MKKSPGGGRKGSQDPAPQFILTPPEDIEGSQQRKKLSNASFVSIPIPKDITGHEYIQSILQDAQYVSNNEYEVEIKEAQRCLKLLRYLTLVILGGLSLAFLFISFLGNSDPLVAFRCRISLMFTLIVLLLAQFAIWVYEKHTYKQNAVIILRPTELIETRY